MKQLLLSLWLTGILASYALAQTDNAGFTYGEFKTGYGITRFGSGLSERAEAGNFSASGGALSSIAAYRKFERLDYLHLGLKFKGLGASPSTGNNGEEMFFNFWGTAFSAKFFPLARNAEKGMFLQADYNFVTQFTQKYRNISLQQYDHQFAIGSSFTFGLGYAFPLKNRYGLIASVEYDLASRTGEVTNLGDQNFRNSNIAFQLGITF